MPAPTIGDVWLLATDGLVTVWVKVDGRWRVALDAVQTKDCETSHCVNHENAWAWPLAHVETEKV